jgi:acyl-CoA synthetase (AMP-forming)/AMP-acid ligase II
VSIIKIIYRRFNRFCLYANNDVVLNPTIRFHTGDLGTMTPEGWVKVTGRLKELYKLENGKYGELKIENGPTDIQQLQSY